MRSIIRTLFVAGVTKGASNFQHHNLVATLKFAIADIQTPTHERQQRCLSLIVCAENRAKSSLFHSVPYHIQYTLNVHKALLLSLSEVRYLCFNFCLEFHLSLPRSQFWNCTLTVHTMRLEGPEVTGSFLLRFFVRLSCYDYLSLSFSQHSHLSLTILSAHMQ